METKININNLKQQLNERLYVVQWHTNGEISITPEDIGDGYCEQCGDYDVSNDGSDTLGDLLLSIMNIITFFGQINSLNKQDYAELKKILSDNGFKLNMSLSEVNTYYFGSINNLK